MADSLLGEIKTIIRGLLVSSPEQLTVWKLRHDFKIQEGHDIPFFQYGYRDVTAFLRSIPDVCKISQPDSGPYAIVRLVESEKSAHVSSLVLRQKTTTKGRRQRPSIPVRGRSSHVSYKPAVTCNPKNVAHSTVSNQKINGLQSYNHISAYQRSLTNNNELSEFSVDNAPYSVQNGVIKDISKWLNGVEENTESQESYFPDVSGNDFANLEAFVDFHLGNILICSKGLELNVVQEFLQNALSAYETNYELSSVDLVQILKRIPYISIVDNRVYRKLCVGPLYKEHLSEETDYCMKQENTAVEVNEGLEDDNANICKKQDLTAVSDTFIPTGSTEKVQRLERNLYSLIKDHIHGILGSELKEKYKMKFAAPLNFQTLGCETPFDLASNMPHIFSYAPLDNGDFKLFSSAHYSGKMLQNQNEDVVALNKELIIPEITKRNMQWLMQGYPNGLNAKFFEKTYTDTYLNVIELKQMGLSSIEEFLHHMEELNIIKIQVAESDIWLLPSQNFVNLTVHENRLPLPEIMKDVIDIKTLKEKFPCDVVGPDKHVQQVEIPSWIVRSSLIEILVQEVNNPHHFWVTFCGDQYSRALDSLMDDLQAFYCSKSHSYRMPPEFIREGQDCVTQYVEEWHRARITSIISATEVEVCFYDYGTRRVVQKDNIHYLHTSHSDLPAQAVRAVLANVAPKGDKWTQEASKRFLQLIANKALIGIVISADRINKVFSLFLCDTSGDDDIYIHEVLVSEDYAVEIVIDTTGKESNQMDANATEPEEYLEHETLLVSEEEVDKNQSDVNFIGKDFKLEKYPKWSTNVHNDNTPYTEAVQEVHSLSSSRKTSQSSLPYTLANDKSNLLLSVSTSVSVGATTTSTTMGASIVTNPVSNSSDLHEPIAPPPAFSHVLKCETELDSDKTESQTLYCISKIDQSEEVEAVLETSKMQTSPDNKECDDREDPVTTKCGKIDHDQTVKGVSSGVNANISQDAKAPYLQNCYTYPNWAPVPQTYANFSAFPPSFPPMNAIASLSLNPFHVPTIPNPLEYCNMWYYERCRQEAFLQGMLAHQQMTASTFPSLPPGIFLPQGYSTQSYSQPSSQNHMNISEVHSPESRVIKTNSKESSLVCVGEGITTGTQTEVASSAEKELILSNKPSEPSPPTKVSGYSVAPESRADTNEDYVHIYENIYFNNDTECKATSQTNVNDLGAVSPLTYVAAVNKVLSEEVIVKDIVENTICYSSSQTNEAESLDTCRNDMKLNPPPGLSGNVMIRKTQLVLDKDPVMQGSIASHYTTDLVNSIGKTKGDNENHPLEQIFSEEPTKPNSHVNSSLVDVHNFEVQYNGEPKSDEISPAKNTSVSQICNTIPEENETVLNSSRNVNDQHCVEDELVKANSNLRISQQNADSISVLESEFSEMEEKEIAQVVFTDSLFEGEANFHEDDYHERIMIEKAQQECALNKYFESNDTVVATKNVPVAIAVRKQLFTEEGKDMINEKETDTGFSSGNQPLICDMFSYGASEKQKSKLVGRESDSRDYINKSEGITDHPVGQEQRVIAPRENSKIIPLIPDDSNKEVSQNPFYMTETFCTELGALSVSDEHVNTNNTRPKVQHGATNQERPHLNSQVTEIQYTLPSRSEKNTIDSVCKIQTSSSKRVRPVLGAKLSKEVSASFISGPTQPAMTQKIHLSPPIGSSVQTKDSVSCDTLLLPPPVSWKTTWNTEQLTRVNSQGQMGHDSTKNMSNSSQFRNAPKQSAPKRHRESPSSLKQGKNYQFVKMIYLSGKQIHQINLDGRPYVLTDEIVSYFTPFNGRHVIIKILEARKVEINFLELSRRRRPELFECFDKSEIKWMSRGPTGNVIGSVHIVPLRSVPYMLRALNRDDAALTMDVKEEMEKFDTSDPYWSGSYD